MGFPVSPQPSPGDTYSVENRVWTYDGYGWRFLGASGSVNVTLTGNVNYTIGNTAPSGPNSGDKWFHINDAVEYTYIQDLDSTSHWIEIGMGCPSIGGETGINFPVTECIGDIYEYDSRIWIYKGYGWKIVCQNTGDSEFTFGLTAPNNPNPGHRWVDSATGLLYTFVNDYDPLGQTGQWVAFSNASEIIGPVGPTGGTGPIGPTGPTGPTGSSYLYDLLDVSIDPEVDYGSANDGKFLRFNFAQNKWVMSDIFGLGGGSNFVNTINGCTGNIGITGTANEIEVINACPNITIGLPQNITVAGNLTVNGFYFGFIDGGTFE